MGGTIPVIGQYAIRERLRCGSTSALLYGTNTLGAAVGALMGGFFMPLWFGFRLTCIIAIIITVAVAALAWLVSRSPAAARTPETDSLNVESPATHADAVDSTKYRGNRLTLWAICFLSGFGILALEVLWTRMFALVFENSVYTFAAILVVVLCCLAGGSLISSFLARKKWSPNLVLASLLSLSGFSIALTDQFPQVERVLTCELLPDVITAAKEFMTNVDGVDLTNGLFTDPRSTVLAEDGRHHLMATREKFDVINSDLFIPYSSGTGSLLLGICYGREGR